MAILTVEPVDVVVGAALERGRRVRGVRGERDVRRVRGVRRRRERRVCSVGSVGSVGSERHQRRGGRARLAAPRLQLRARHHALVHQAAVCGRGHDISIPLYDDDIRTSFLRRGF